MNALLMNEDGSFLSVSGLERSFPVPAGLWRKPERRMVLRGVDFTLWPGERVALVGASGSGKTTLLRSLLAIDAPDCGHILCQCKPVRPAGMAELRWYRQSVQYIPQDPAASLDPRITVRQQIAEPLRRLGVDCDHDVRIRESLQRVGLGPELLLRRRNELSGGQAQRVAIARAIATRPAFLLADEPMSGLDLPIRRQVAAVLRDLSENQGTGLLIVSHDIVDVSRLCTRTVVMYDGAIVEDRPSAELLADPHHPAARGLVAAALPDAARLPAPQA